MSRRGWSLHEMMISLGVMAVALGLAAHASVVHLRFFRGAGEIVAVRSQLSVVGTVVAAIVWGVATAGGDILVAADSALEVRSAVGSAVVCGTGPGQVTIPAAEPRGNTLSGFEAMPDVGDFIHAFVGDSIGSGWIRATVASVAPGAGACPPAASVAGLTLTLAEPIELPAGAVLRISRSMRMSSYRASDGMWYFGVRDWNAATGRLNTIQPVAGPLEPYSADATRSGLLFRYFDATGLELPVPVDVGRVATIQVTARARSRRPVSVAGLGRQGVAYVDSTTTTVSFRNAQ